MPAFAIDLSEEQRLRKMRTFNETVIQTQDVNLHGKGYSQDFVDVVEQTLLLVTKLTEIFFQLNRKDVFFPFILKRD